MFVSLLTLYLIVRRSGLKVKMFPRHARREKGRAVKPAQVNYLFFPLAMRKATRPSSGTVSSWMHKKNQEQPSPPAYSPPVSPKPTE